MEITDVVEIEPKQFGFHLREDCCVHCKRHTETVHVNGYRKCQDCIESVDSRGLGMEFVESIRQPATREVLDNVMGKCGISGCDHSGHEGMFIHGGCHPYEDVQAMYKDGAIYFKCGDRSCNQEIINVKVSE